MKLQVGGKILFAPEIWLQVRQVWLSGETQPVPKPTPPPEPLERGSQGYFIHSLPIAGVQPVLRRSQGYICYVPKQYQRYYIDMRQTFTDYQRKFSSKTVSTIKRKLRKFSDHCGGRVRLEVYRTVDDMREFFRLARLVSAKTYQEKLLDAGLPDSEDFMRRMEALAAEDHVRAFTWFDRDKPWSYLYCPIRDGVLRYHYLGYDPEYMSFSVGTILLWLALGELFADRCFRSFDFTEGQGDQKRLFSTHSIQCADVMFLRPTVSNIVLILSQRAVDQVSKCVGDTLSRLGLKVRIKKLIRFGRSGLQSETVR